MVQIIQSGPSSATLRQQALDQALQGAVQGFGNYQKQESDKALTLRQQALKDQQTALQLNAQGIDASPQDLRDYVAGTYKAKEITPATPDSFALGQIASPADLKRQDEMGNVSQVYTPGTKAVMGNANPLMNYTESKRAQMAQALKDKELANRTAESTISRNAASTAKDNATAKFTNEYKPDLIQSQIDKNNKYVPGGSGANNSQKDLENFRKAHDPSVASSRSPIGKEFSKYQQAQHALKLVAEFGDNMDAVSSMKKRELAVTLATMLSPGLPHESTIAHLDEPTLNSYLAEKMQAITGSPQGTNSAGMVKQLKDSVMSQAELSMQNIDRYQKGVEASYSQKINQNPDAYNGIMGSTRIAGAPSFLSHSTAPVAVPPPGGDPGFEAWKKAKGHK